MAATTSAWADDFLLTPVCVVPAGIPEDIARNGWAFGPNGSTILRMRREEFKKASRGQMVYVFDPAAPPENTKLLPIAYHDLKCKPYSPPVAPPVSPSADPAAGPPPAAAGKSSSEPSKAVKKKPADTNEPEVPPDLPQPIVYPKNDTEPKPRPPSHGVTTHWPRTVLPVRREQVDTRTKVLPMAHVLPVEREQVDTQTKVLPMAHVLPFRHEVEKSGKGGNGGTGTDGAVAAAEPSVLDTFSKEMAYAGALANIDLNHDTKRPDGKQYGIPSGKNATGPNNPVAQAVAGAIGVVAAVLSAGTGGFRKKFVEALKKGEPLAYKEMAELGEKGAEELIEELVKAKGKDGRAYLAQALSSTGTIGPYSVMRKFTDNLGGKWQAHHILEEQMIRRFRLGKPELGPSVILTDAEHKVMTAKLRAKTADSRTAQELWEAYKDVYKDYPSWLDAVKPHLVKGK